MKMRAAVLDRMEIPRPYTTTRPITVETVELDSPGPGEVLVKITGAGLCHSDLSIVNGDRPRQMPMALGHEAAGIVEECGPGVTDLARGDSVALVFVPSCGHCIPCMEGRPALCEPGAAANGAGTLVGGHRRLHRSDGSPLNHQVGVSCFAEYAVVARGSLVKVRPDLDPAVAAVFGCAVLTGAGAAMNSAQVRLGGFAWGPPSRRPRHPVAVRWEGKASPQPFFPGCPHEAHRIRLRPRSPGQPWQPHGHGPGPAQ